MWTGPDGSTGMADLAAITHDGKVVVVGSGQDGVLRYTVRQSGFENSAVAPVDSGGLPGFEKWKPVPLNRATFDPSVSAFERNNLVNDSGQPILRSIYGRAGTRSSTGRVKLLSCLDHLYLFRVEPNSQRLLMNRFVLDGMENELVPKLEVRYTRSRQKLAPEGGTSGAGAVDLDTLAYRDTAQKPFFEPAKELSFLGRFDVDKPWFSVELIPTGEHGKHRWCFFVFTADGDGPPLMRLFSVAASADGLIDPLDQRRTQQDPDKVDRKIVTTISGIVERSLLLPGEVAAGFDSTLYNNQVSRMTKSGQQLLKDSTRVMVAIPVQLDSDTDPSIAALSFTVSNLGMLALVDRSGETEVLSGNPKEVLLPLTNLDGIKLITDRTPPPTGDISRLSETADGTVNLSSTKSVADQPGIAAGRDVRVWGTRSHDGTYIARSVDEETGTFELEDVSAKDQGVQGHWELVDDGAGLTFDNMIAAYEPTADGRLKITCTSLSLSDGDEVRIEGTQAHDGVYPVTAVNPDDNSFVIDRAWPLGEVVNLSVRNRRGLSFDGDGDYLRVDRVELPALSQSGRVERTFSAWVQMDPLSSKAQTLFSCESKLLKVAVDDAGQLVASTNFADGHVASITDPTPLAPGQWEHVAVVLSFDGDQTGETNLTILRAGGEVASIVVPQRKPLLLPLRNLHLAEQALPISTTFDTTHETSALTIEAWVKPNGGTRGVIASWQQYGSFELCVNGPTGAQFVEWVTNESTLIGQTLLSVDRWHHVAGSFDPVSGESTIVVDGQLDTVATAPGPAIERLLTPADATAVQRPFVLGALGAPTQSVKASAATTALFTHDAGSWKQIGPRSWTELDLEGNPNGQPLLELQRTDTTIELRSEYSRAAAGLPDVALDVGSEAPVATRWSEERLEGRWQPDADQRTSAEVQSFAWLNRDGSGNETRESFERTSQSEWQLAREGSIEYYTEYHRSGNSLWLKFDRSIDTLGTFGSIGAAVEDSVDAVGGFFGDLFGATAAVPQVVRSARSALHSSWAQVDFGRGIFMLTDVDTGTVESVQYADPSKTSADSLSRVETEHGSFELRTPHLRQWVEFDTQGQQVGEVFAEVRRTHSTVELRQAGADFRIIFDVALGTWTRVNERVPSTTTGGVVHALNPAPGLTDRYQGALAEVRIWQQARSVEQVDTSMAAALDGSEPGLIAYWTLAETTSSEASDLTKNKVLLDLTGLRAPRAIPAIRDLTAAAQRLTTDPLAGRAEIATVIQMLTARAADPLLVTDPGLDTTSGSVTEAANAATIALSLARRLTPERPMGAAAAQRFVAFDASALSATSSSPQNFAETALAHLAELGADAETPVVVISDFGLLVESVDKIPLAVALKELSVVGLVTSNHNAAHIETDGWWRHSFDPVDVLVPIHATEIPPASAWHPSPHRAPGSVAAYRGGPWGESYLLGADFSELAPRSHGTELADGIGKDSTETDGGDEDNADVDDDEADGSGASSYFAGKLSEVELWTANPTPEAIRQAMYLQLQGNEYGLDHYWRCGGILADAAPGAEARLTPDLGPGARDAVIVGDVFVSARDLPRRNGAGLAVRFTNDDLVAVSQGGTYEETFEFRAMAGDGTHWSLHDLSNADGNGSPLFSMRYWGKRSRTSDDIVDFPAAAVQTNDIVDLGDGWFLAKTRFTIPNDVNLLRCFELDKIKGLADGDAAEPDDWSTLSIRRHRIQLVSNVVSRTRYSDDISRLERVDDNGLALRTTVADLPAFERGLARKRYEINDIGERLVAFELLSELASQVSETQNDLRRTNTQLQNAREVLRNYETDIFNHVLQLSNTGTGGLIGVVDDQLAIGPEAQATSFTIERRGASECQVRLLSGGFLGVRDRAAVTTHREDERALGFLWKTGVREWTEPITHDNEIYVASSGSREATWRLVKRGDERIELRNTVHDVFLGCTPAITMGTFSAPPFLVGLGYQGTTELSQWKLLRVGGVRPEGYEAERSVRQAKVETVLGQKQALENRLAWLNEVLSMSGDDAQNLRTRRDQLRTEANGLQSQIGDINHSFLSLKSTARAATMALVAQDALGLSTYGSLLALASPATSVTVDATAEGNVQLSYFDTNGRFRFTNYDATSDSTNSNFEEWLGSNAPVCVELVHDDAHISVDPIELPRAGNTIEGWFYYPIPENSTRDETTGELGASVSRTGQRNRLAFLTSDAAGSEAAIAMSSGRRLGTVVDGFFHDAGVDVDAHLDRGWHHVAATTQGTVTAFYLDGDPVDSGNGVTGPPARFAREFGYAGSAVGQAEADAFAITNNYSFQAWVRIEAGPASGFGHLFRTAHGAHLGWTGNKTPGFWLRHGADEASTVTVELPNGFQGDWVNLAATVSNNVAVLYIDGVQAKRAEFSGEFGTGRFEIGRASLLGRDAHAQAPLLSDAQLWNRALSAHEVLAHMYVAPDPRADGLVGHWPMSLIELNGIPALRDVHEPSGDQKQVHLRMGPSMPADRLEQMTHPLPSTATKPITTLGNRPGGGAPAGRVGQFRFWSAALSDEEIRINALTELTGNEPDLIACYPLDDLTAHSTDAPDVTGGQPGKLERARVVARSAALGNPGARVAVFDGRRRGERQTAIHVSEVDLRESVTIEFWVKRSGADVETFVSTLSQEPARAIELKVDHEELTVVFGASSIVAELGRRGIDRWMHIAVAYNHEAQTLSLFTDSAHLQSVGGIAPLASQSVLALGVGTSETAGALSGQMAEFRVWSTARSEQEVRTSFRSRAAGGEQGLSVALPLDDRFGIERITNLAAASSDPTTPRGMPGSVRSDDLPMVPGQSLITAEYSTVSSNPDGTGGQRALLRRFFGFAGAGGDVTLLPGKRIEELVLKWIGNAQFEPTLLGFIEGAPPVPSENLTIDTDYDGGTTVELVMSDEVEYSWNRSTDIGGGLDINAFLGIGWQVGAGIGIETQVTEGHLGLRGSASTEWRREASSNIRAGSTQTSRDELELRGSFEIDPKFPHLGPRYVPKNVGYALVVSGMADVFITQMKRTGRMIAYEVQPAKDMPPDVNTITFLLNPAYTLNGSLDGLVGSHAADERFYEHVPEMRSQHGSRYPASYYNLSEAYALKARIEELDVGREAYFAAFESEAVMGLGDGLLDDIPAAGDGTGSNLADSLDDEPGTEPTEGDTRSERERNRDDKKQLEKKLEKTKGESEADADKRVDGIKERFGNSEKQQEADAAFKTWQRKMEGLQVAAAKRNIQNTYVWDADGGIRYEEESFATTIEHTVGGSFNLNASLGRDLNIQISTFKAELQAMATLAMSQTMTKSRSSTRSFELNVRMDRVERRGVTDADDYPIQPGEKVDRYRFMSFYLEGDTDHFHDFFREVVDPEWFMSNDEEARALRQVARGKPNKTWRVLHRVTYVERPALMGFGRDLRVADDLEEAAEEVYNYFDALEEDNNELRGQVSALSGEIKNLSAKFDQVIDRNANGGNGHVPSTNGGQPATTTGGEPVAPDPGNGVIDLSDGGNSPPANTAPGNTTPVNTALARLNAADADELEALIGVGPALAVAIINHRRANGPFETMGELVEISGIGAIMMDQLRTQLEA